MTKRTSSVENIPIPAAEEYSRSHPCTENVSAGFYGSRMSHDSRTYYCVVLPTVSGTAVCIHTPGRVGTPSSGG